MTRIELGYVAMDEQTGTVWAGSLYSGGAKVYRTEKVARASVKNHTNTTYVFLPAFIEVPDHWIEEGKNELG